MADVWAGKPDAFLVDREPHIPWEQWKQNWQVYVMRRQIQLERLQRRAPDANPGGGGDAAQQADCYSKREKNLDLYSLLGAEGQRLFLGTTDSTNFDRDHDTVLGVCDTLFSVKVNPLIAIDRFRHRLQRPGEKASDWCAELRVLSKQCKFETVEIENREIKINLALNCHDQELKQKIFAQHANSTLDVILDFMTTHEQSIADVKLLNTSQGSATAAAVGLRQNNRRKTQKTSTVGENFSPCEGCGKKGHKYGDSNCSAHGKPCTFCKRKNHFWQVCRKRLSQQPKSQCAVKNRVAATQKNGSRIICKLKLQPNKSHKGQSCSFIADTASDVTTLIESEFRRLFPKTPITGPLVRLQNFDDSPAPAPLGSVKMIASFGPRHSAEIEVHIVQDQCLSLLGFDDMALLNLKLDTTSRKVFAVSKKSSPASCTSDQLQESLLNEFSQLFSPGIGKVEGFEHTIQLKEDAKPVRFKLRHPPFAIREKGSEAIENLLRDDITEQADKSDWVHPVHFVWKPDNDVRTTVDFSHGINKFLVPTSHPLPLPADIFRSVSEDQFFSIGDVVQAYYSVPLAPESRPLTCFLTESHGLLQFKRLPMGMTDSGAVFQRCIEKCLEGLPGVYPYIDDILISGKTREEHDSRLRAALERLQSSGFRLKKSKLVVAKQEVSFLGHILSATPNGTTIKPDPRNGDAIRNLRPPTDIHGVRQFLGCCNYYSSHIKNFAELSEPLLHLTRKNVPFVWDNLCQKSFDLLKAEISSPQVLVPFNPAYPTVLTTDASDVGLGAVLSQWQNGEDRPIAFAAKTLTSPERNYSTPEREALGSVWATEHFEKFLLGRHFTLRTDQNSLLALMSHYSDTRKSRRISRWRERLHHFNYMVKHIQGRKNVCADMLSRLGAQLEPSSLPSIPNDDDTVIIAAVSVSTNVPVSELVSESASDSDFQLIRKYLLTDSWPPRKQIPDRLKGFFDVRTELSAVDSCLFRGEKWIVPVSLRQRILKMLHSGHPGIARMRQKYDASYYWPGGSKMVARSQIHTF